MAALVVAGEAHALLVTVGRRLEHRLNSFFKEIDLSASQFEIMNFLWQQDHLTLGELSEFCGCVPANITGLVDRLERKGLLERVSVPGDRRIARIALTEKGQKLREPAAKVVERYLEVFNGLEAEELRSFVAMLIKLYRSLESPGTDLFLKMLARTESISEQKSKQ